MTKLKNQNCNQTKKKTKIVTKLKKTQIGRKSKRKLKFLQNSLTKIVTKLKKKQIVTKFKNPNCDKNQKLKLGQNSKNKIVTKLKNSNCGKTQILKL